MMDLIFNIPRKESSILKIIGVGGGGGNMLEYMYNYGINGVDFVVCDTDAQDLENNPVKHKILLGETLTQGRGAGSEPEKGEQAAIESLDSIRDTLKDNTKMVVILAGMGGGTGTGATPVIAKEIKEMGILSLAILTIPFRFEAKSKYNQAISGIMQLKENVDGLVLIHNEMLRDMYIEYDVRDVFSKANEILLNAIKGVAEIITLHGHINLDLADLETIMKESGIVILGYAKARGKRRSKKAIKSTLNSLLLNNASIKGAKKVLLNITSGEYEITLDEVGVITEYIQQETGMQPQIIWGIRRDMELTDEITLTLIATKLEDASIPDLINIPEKIDLFSSEEIAFDFQFDKSEKVISQEMPESQIKEFEKQPAYLRYNKG